MNSTKRMENSGFELRIVQKEIVFHSHVQCMHNYEVDNLTFRKGVEFAAFHHHIHLSMLTRIGENFETPTNCITNFLLCKNNKERNEKELEEVQDCFEMILKIVEELRKRRKSEKPLKIM